jgi:hypothetical protein
MGEGPNAAHPERNAVSHTEDRKRGCGEDAPKAFLMKCNANVAAAGRNELPFLPLEQGKSQAPSSREVRSRLARVIDV